MSKISHYFSFGNWYFVTTTTFNYEPFFLNKNNAEIVINVLYSLVQKNSVSVDSMVVMPEHVHAILIPQDNALSDIMRNWKRSVTRIINHNENVKNRKIWMDEYFDRQIINEIDLRKKRNYISLNPVKRMLVNKPEDYLFSTANNKIKQLFDY